MKKKHDETVDEEYVYETDPETSQDADEEYVEYEATADPDQPEEFYEEQPDDTYYEYEEEQPEESQTGDEQPSKEDKKAKKSVFATTFGNTPFYETTAETISDVLSFHHYKRLKLAPAILLGIALSPFLISFIMLAASFYVLLFAYKMLIAPADYMITSMKSDHDSIWVQLIIYLMGYPVVLVFRIAGALIGIGFFFINFLINCFGYVYSLGGIHFHAFLYDTPSQHNGFKKTPYTMAENIVALVCAIVILVGYMTGIIVSAVGSGSSYDYGNYDDYASNTSRSDAQSMSPSDRDTFLVRDGDSIWIRVYVDSYESASVNVYSENTNTIRLYLYEENNSSYSNYTSGSSSAAISLPSTYYDYGTTYYIKITCSFISDSGKVTVRIY